MTGCKRQQQAQGPDFAAQPHGGAGGSFPTRCVCIGGALHEVLLRPPQRAKEAAYKAYL